MTLNKVENFFLLLYIYLAPLIYFEVSIPLFGGTFGKVISLILLALLVLRLLVTLELPKFPKVGFGRFLLYVILISTLSLFFAIPFAADYASNLRFSAQPIPRYLVQMGSLFSMAPIFYYSYRYALKNGSLFQKHLMAVFGIIVVAGIYQLLAFYVNLPYWGISTDRPSVGVKAIGPVSILRVNSFAGEPKGLASLLLILVIPFLLYRHKFRSERNKYIGYGALTLFILTFSASGYATFLLAIIFTVYILVVHFQQPRRQLFSTIGSIGILSSIGFLLALVYAPIRRLLLEQFDRIGAVTGLNTGRAFLQQIYLDIPVLGKIPFDATDASPMAFMLNHPWTMITGVGDGMISIYAREFFGSYHGWMDIGYEGIIDPSIGIVQYLADWGIIGITLFVLVILKILKRVKRVIKTNVLSHIEENTILFWALSLIPMSLFLFNIGNGYSGFLLPGLVVGYTHFLEKKYNLK